MNVHLSAYAHRPVVDGVSRVSNLRYGRGVYRVNTADGTFILYQAADMRFQISFVPSEMLLDVAFTLSEVKCRPPIGRCDSTPNVKSTGMEHVVTSDEEYTCTTSLRKHKTEIFAIIPSGPSKCLL